MFVKLDKYCMPYIWQNIYGKNKAMRRMWEKNTQDEGEERKKWRMNVWARKFGMIQEIQMDFHLCEKMK
jgi:hypothetical protein